LQDRLRSRILTIGDHSRFSAQTKALLERLEDLVGTLKLVEHPMETDALRDALKMIVIKCAQVARLGSTNSVEEHLKSLGVQTRLAESPEIRQVDKLARYFFACRDLARIARKPSYQRLFEHIEIMALQSPQGLARPGSAQHCFVHAEIQQIFYSEQQPHTPAPRAIGCSKSACYLCDLFIRTHGDYVVSHTHGRIYEKWTLPDVEWMTAAQTDRYQCVVQNMVREMREAIQSLKGGGRIISSYPLESRACLPLSSGANSSLAERGKEVGEEVHQTRHIDALDPLLPRRYSWPVVLPPFIKITEVDLPWHRYTRVGQGPLHVQIDTLSLHIEFASTATGLLSICPRQRGSLDESKILKVLDIPVDSDFPVRGSRASQKVAFGISLNAIRIIQFEFIWETPSH
ncbi:ott 1508-like deaminase, partial [Colletotrichum incanum]